VKVKTETRTMYLKCGCIQRATWFASTAPLKVQWCVKHFGNYRVVKTYRWKG